MQAFSILSSIQIDFMSSENSVFYSVAGLPVIAIRLMKSYEKLLILFMDFYSTNPINTHKYKSIVGAPYVAPDPRHRGSDFLQYFRQMSWFSC